MKSVLYPDVHYSYYEEFNTLLTKVEAVLNSRPICCINAIPNDRIDILTPGHFLVGAPLVARPEYDLEHVKVSTLKRWHLVSQANQSFWKRWSEDYLNTLIQRYKWTTHKVNIKVNDVVLVRVIQCSSWQWPLGIAVETYPGNDGVTRVVKVKVGKSEFVRQVSKVALLPIESNL